MEVVVASALGSLTVAASVYGYVMTTKRAEWAAYSFTAHALAVQRVEQARASVWDLMKTPPVDELVATNFPRRK
jgi:hypothetical protein